MGSFFLFFLGILSLLVIYFYFLYANLIRYRNQAEAALSAIEIQLRKRYDLIPNVLRLAQKYLVHERGLFEEVTDLRAKASQQGRSKTPQETKELFELDSLISEKMKAIHVAVEGYPELKANETVIAALKQYQDVEDHISASRRFYNVAAQDLNNAVEIFPGNLVAPLAKAEKLPYYQDGQSGAIHAAPNTNDYLK